MTLRDVLPIERTACKAVGAVSSSGIFTYHRVMAKTPVLQCLICIFAKLMAALSGTD